MKRILALILCAITVLPLFSCSSEIATPTEEQTLQTTTEEKKNKIPSFTFPLTIPPKPEEKREFINLAEMGDFVDENANYPQVADKISWDTINAFPIANSSMTTDELRALCVDFFRFDKTFAWTPNADYNFQKNEKGSQDSMSKGTVYGGLPYVGLGSGSVYRLMDYYDVETGVVNITAAGADRYLFGNQCSIGAYVGWGRVINSADYRWTYDAVESRGFVKVGPYTYRENLEKFDSFYNTVIVCNNNGKDTMYESYALLQPADGLVYYTSAGHIIMCSSKAVVVRDENGKIDGEKSYIYQIDQSQSWKNYTNENGNTIKVKTGVDTKRTFKDMFDDHYVPFTFKEFLGEDPVEEATCEWDHKEETITPEQMKNATVTANYGISDIYLILKDKDGKIVVNNPLRSKSAGKKTWTITDNVVVSDWELYLDKEYTLTVTVQLFNGTRHNIYEGKFVK